MTHQDQLLTFVRLERRTEVLVRLIVRSIFTLEAKNSSEQIYYNYRPYG